MSGVWALGPVMEAVGFGETRARRPLWPLVQSSPPGGVANLTGCQWAGEVLGREGALGWEDWRLEGWGR